MTGFSNLYPNLPGMLVTYKDGGMALKNDITASKTDSMLILGTAVDGPVLEPIAVDDDSAELIFGASKNTNGSNNNATLVKAFKQARKRGCNDIRLMRITGSASKCELEGDTIQISESLRGDEVVDNCSGNEETVLTLENGNLIPNTAKVFIDGEMLISGFVIEESAGRVSINQGVTNAGRGITISYDYSELKNITGEAKVVATSSVTLDHEPVGEVTATYNGTAISPAHLTVAGKVVTIAPEASVTDGDEIILSYQTKGLVNSAIESGTSVAPFITESKVVNKVLAETPVEGSVILYVNGVKYADQSVVSMDYATKEIEFDNKFFSLGDEVVAEYLVEKVTDVKEILTLETHFGGSVYNQTRIKVEDILNDSDQVIGKVVKLTKPASKKANASEVALEFRTVDYRTFGELVEAISGHPMNNICKATTNAESSLTTTLKSGEFTFTGGSDGLNMTDQQMFDALSGKRNAEGYLEIPGAYQLLEDYSVDWIVPVGVYMDTVLADREKSFAYELALTCAVLSNRNKTTLGAISVAPNKDLSIIGVQKYAKKLAALNNVFFMRDAQGNVIKGEGGRPIDLGMYISTVAGPEVVEFDSAIGRFFGNPAIDYVAENTMLLPQVAPTNKQIKGASQLRFTFSNAQLNDITGNRIVTFKQEELRGGVRITMVDGVTAAHPSSDYTRITTPKVLRVTVDNVREVCIPFIGEANSPEKRNAMAAAISKRLSLLAEKGVIADHEFQIIATQQDQLQGGATIELSIIPPQELRKITAVVGLKAN